MAEEKKVTPEVAPKQVAPVKAAPIKEAPKQEAPKQAVPTKEAPVKEAPKQETPVKETSNKRRKVKIILNIVGLVLYLGALLGFLFPYVMVRIYNVRTQQFDGMDYLGWQLALNFDGTWKNLGTLFPLVSVLLAFIFALTFLIKKIARKNKEPKEHKFPALRLTFIALLFVFMAGLITMFLALSSVNIAAPHVNKPYQGHFLGIGAYFTAYCSLLGGLVMFITESGLIKD